MNLTEEQLKKLGSDVTFGHVEGENRGKNPMNPPIIVHDPLYHLRSDDRSSELVIKMLNDENEYAKKQTEHLESERNQLYNDYLKYIKEDSESIRYKYKNYKWFTRTQKDQSYVQYFRVNSENEEEILLDVNEIAKDHKFCDVTELKIHPTKDWVVYTVDFKGSEIYKPYFIDLETKQYIFSEDTEDDFNQQIDNVEWGIDGIFYTTVDDSHRSYKVWYHTLGTKFKDDVCIYTEEDTLFDLLITRSTSGKYLFVISDSCETSQIQTIDLSEKKYNTKMLFPKTFGVKYNIVHQEDYFYVITNKDSSKNNKLMRMPVDESVGLTDVYEYNPSIYLERIQAFKNFIVLQGRFDGFQKVWILTNEIIKNKEEWIQIKTIKDKFETVSLSINEEYDTNYVLIEVESFIYSPKVYSLKFEPQVSYELVWEKIVPNYDPEKYETLRFMVDSSKDNAKIPLFLTRLKGSESKKTILDGYGAYGINLDPRFDTIRVPLLDRGVNYCIANIRGSSVMGKTWYEDEGKYLKKKNTFYDFIDCADYLLKNGYTDSKHLAIEGRSAGGLLMGAVLNMAPEKFAVALCGVPFLDVMNTMCDPSIPLVTQEWEEWGNPNEEKFYEYMKSYSPYDNIRNVKYPKIIVTAGLWDYRVQYWEPLKWVTKLRLKSVDPDILLKVNMNSGHFADTARYTRLKEIAWEYTALLDIINK